MALFFKKSMNRKPDFNRKRSLILMTSSMSFMLLYMNCGQPRFATVQLQSSESVIDASNTDEPSLRPSAYSDQLLSVIDDGSSLKTLRERPLTINGGTFAYGLPVTSRSTLRLEIPEGCSEFNSQVGIDDSSESAGTAHFEIRADDGAKLFEADLDKGHSPVAAQVDLQNLRSKSLTLQVDAASGPVKANWAEAHLVCQEKEIIPTVADMEPAESNAVDSSDLAIDASASTSGEPKAQLAYWNNCGTPSAKAFYVARNGNDSNDGSISRPFKSLGRAVQAMRGSSTKLTLIRAGTYTLTSTLILDSRDNGVRIASYPCERAVLDGGTWLTSGWRSEGGGVYSRAVGNPNTWREVLIDWKRAHAASHKRYNSSQPYTSDWAFAAGGPTKDQKPYNWFKFKSEDLNRSDYSSIEGMMVQYMSWERLKDYTFYISSIDWSKNTIKMGGTQETPASEGTYRLFNNPKFIRDNYDFTWSWKGNEKRLYVKVPSSKSLSTVILPHLMTLIEIRGAQNVSLLRLKLQNTLHWGHAVRLIGGGHHRIGANIFQWVGTGLYLSNSTDNLIGGNDFLSLGSSGVEMAIGSHRNKIFANGFDGIGTIVKHSSAVSGYGISDNQIAQNDIQNSSRYGVSIKNWSDETANFNNVIEYNWIYNTCTETADGGAIEMLGRNKKNTGAIIRGNIIDRYNGFSGINGGWVYGFKGFGIYMDDSTSGVTITGNLIKNVGKGLANIYLHGGDYNIVEHNIGIMDHEDNNFIRMEKVAVGGDMNYHNSIQRNVVYGNKPFRDYVFYTSGNYNTINYNIVYNAGKYKNGVGFDQNTSTRDPKFENAAAGNYRLRSDSPAWGMGIKQPEWGKMGRKSYHHTSQLPAFWTAPL